MIYRITVLAIFFLSCVTVTNAQVKELPFQSIHLNTLESFNAPTSNWKIAGDVQCDRNVVDHIKALPGTGVLVNVFEAKGSKDLYTTWDHGDLDIEFEFMMAKNSNAGIYLQGQYEIQLLDSWGVRNPTYSDLGGIYERWDEAKPEGKKGFEGTPPSQNVSKAPGLWQKMRIQFQAPKFNDKGLKTSNAKILKVDLNGVTIHENVILSGPTRGGAYPLEKARGPLRIQGDHGAFAMRSIKYKSYDKATVTASDLSYSYYEGKFKKIADKDSSKPLIKADAQELTWEVAKSQNDFIVAYNGKLQVKEDGDYLFRLHNNGRVKMEIGDKTVFELQSWATDIPSYAKLTLSKGTIPFQLVYFKDFAWTKPNLGLYIEGPGSRWTPLHSSGSFLPEESEGDNYLLAEHGVTVQRNFIEFKNKRRPFGMGVGEPSGVNYSLDLSNGSILQIWKGMFYNATGMWKGRSGELGMTPMGSVIELDGAPLIAALASETSPWPDSLRGEDNFSLKGYTLDQDGRPTIKYTYNGLTLEDKSGAGEGGKVLNRAIKISNIKNGNGKVWIRIASGSKIMKLKDGSYSVNDNEFYIKPSKATKVLVRSSGGKDEILVPVSNTSDLLEINYSLIW
ncbi:MAG TPA: family 16 glycoside hydrolase [Cytophagaceae bacterium]|jgi:hypothetical protein